MSKWEDLNEDPEKWFARAQAKLIREAQRSNTRPTGVKDYGESGDAVWTDPTTGEEESVRGVVGKVSEVGIQIEEAKAAITEAEGVITDLKDVRLPALREDLDQAQQEASDSFAALDQKFNEVPTSEELEQVRTNLGDVLTTAQDAQAEAEQASANALAAAGIAADKGRVYYQSSAPTDDASKSVHNLWIDSDDGKVYVWNTATSSWKESESQSLRDAAQAALLAQQTADAAVAAAASAMAAAVEAQRTADQSTLDAADAFNEAVAAAERAEQLRLAGENLLTMGDFERGTLEEIFSGAGGTAATFGWTQLVDTETAHKGSRFIRLLGDVGANGWNGTLFLKEVPVTPGRTYRVSVAARITPGMAAPSGSVGWPMYWFQQDGSAHNGNWPKIYYNADLASKLTEEWQVFTADVTALPGAASLRPRLYGGTGSILPGEGVDFDDVRLIDATELVAAEAVAQAAQAAADAAMIEASAAKGLAQDAVREVGDTVRDTVIEYAVNTSETAAPTSGWSTATPVRTPGSFVWMRTIVTYADGDTSTTSPALLTGNAGAKGDTGSTGATGVGITSVTPFFRAVARTAGAPAQPTGMTPSGWTTAEPAWSASNKLYRAERIVYSNNTVSWTPAVLVATYEGIVAVAASANGKNAITLSVDAPTTGTPGVVTGDTWWRIDGDGQIYGQWRWTGSAWVAATIRSEVIANLDVNKLTVTGSSRFSEAVIENLWVNSLVARVLITSKLTVSSGNVHRDPMLTDPASWNASYYKPDGGYGGGGSILLPASTSQVGTYDTLGASVASTRTRVEPGVTYRHTFWFKSSIPVTARNRVVMFRRYYTIDGSVLGSVIAAAQADPAPADTWTQASGEEKVPEGGVTMVIGFYTQAGHNGEVRFSDPGIVAKTGTVLIEDGAVKAQQVDAESVGAAVGDFVKARIENLTVTGGATIPQAVILKLAAEMITSGLFRTSDVGQRVQIDQTGVTMYGADEGELVRIGPSGENLITIGQSTVSTDSVSSPIGSFDELTVGGDDLASVLARLPKGRIGQNRYAAVSAYSSEQQIRLSTSVDLEGGRQYRVTVNPFDVQAQGNTDIIYRLGWMWGGSPGTWTTTNILGTGRNQMNGTSEQQIPGIIGDLHTGPTQTGQMTFALFTSTSNSQGVRIVADGSHPILLSVDDMGPRVEDAGAYWTYGNGGGGDPTPPPPATTTKTTTWASGGFGGDTSAGDVVQGYYPGVGNRYGGWVFPSTMVTALSGSTIAKFEVYLYATHWYWGSGGTASIRPNNGGYKGTNWPTTQHLSSKWPRNSGRWVTLPSTWYPFFASGTYKGISVQTSSNDYIYYGRFKGDAAKFRVTYKK